MMENRMEISGEKDSVSGRAETAAVPETHLCSTIREILVESERKYGPLDAVRFKQGKGSIAVRSYTQLRHDSESFSCAIRAMLPQGAHVAVTGMTHTLAGGLPGNGERRGVAVPLDVSLPAEELCELVDRSDAEALVLDEVRKDVEAIARQRCPKLKYLISMQKPEDDETALSFSGLLKKYEGSFDMSRSRISFARSCSPPEPRERARASC